MQKDTIRKILKIQEEIFAKNERCRSLQHLYYNTQEKVKNIEENTPNQSDIETMENALHAELALGLSPDSPECEETKKELVNLENKLLEGDNLKKTVAGLKCKWDTSESEAKQLNSKHKALVEEYLRNRLEELGIHYMEAAENLLSLFREIMVTGRFHEQFGGSMNRIVTGHEFGNINIPIFMLSACGQHPNNTRNWPNWTKAEELTNRSQDTIDEEEKVLRDLVAKEIYFNPSTRPHDE